MGELHDDDWDLPAGVPRTAVGVAWIRAGESKRPDRLFDDPYALPFVLAARPPRPQGAPPPARREPSPAGLAMSRRVVLRTRFFDDYLTGAAASGIRQVVLLAAGLDTRAFRLDWPGGTRLFELDLPEMTAFKERVLAGQDARPRCERTVVPGDLLGPWAERLADAGFDAAQPTAWLLEGLLVYLDRPQAQTLMTGLGRVSAPGSRLSLTDARGMWRDTGGAEGGDAYRELFALWKGGLGEPAGEWLERNGWTVTRHARTDLEAAYGRISPPTPEASGGAGVSGGAEVSGSAGVSGSAEASGGAGAPAAGPFDGFVTAERDG